MYLKTFITSSNKTSKVFNIPLEKLGNKYLNVLFKNKGVYNGLIGLLLIYGACFSSSPLEIVRMLLIYIILVVLYSSLTSDKTIILKQVGLSIIALITSFI